MNGSRAHLNRSSVDPEQGGLASGAYGRLVAFQRLLVELLCRTQQQLNEALQRNRELEAQVAEFQWAQFGCKSEVQSKPADSGTASGVPKVSARAAAARRRGRCCRRSASGGNCPRRSDAARSSGRGISRFCRSKGRREAVFPVTLPQLFRKVDAIRTAQTCLHLTSSAASVAVSIRPDADHCLSIRVLFPPWTDGSAHH